VLQVNDIHTWYGDSYVLQGVTLEVKDGTVVALLGRNGMGKTTLLITLMGLTRVRAGRMRWRGADLAALPTHRRSQAGLGWVPQERFMFPSLTVEEHLTAVARPGHWNVARVYEVFPRLAERRGNFGNQLSGGEQQMLAIGRALMTEPKLMLLDEPSMGLAPFLIQAIMKIIRKLNEQGTTILLVEQNAKVALKLADYGYVLETGQIVIEGDGATLRQDESIVKAYLGGGH